MRQVRSLDELDEGALSPSRYVDQLIPVGRVSANSRVDIPGGGRDGMPVIGVDGVSHQGMHGRGLRVPLGGFLGVLSPSATARRGPPFGLAGTPICRSRWSRGDCEGCLPRIVVTRAVCRFRRWFRVALAGGDPQQTCARRFARRQSFDEGVEDRKAWASRLRREQRLKSGIVTTSSAGTPSGQPDGTFVAGMKVQLSTRAGSHPARWCRGCLRRATRRPCAQACRMSRCRGRRRLPPPTPLHQVRTCG